MPATLRREDDLWVARLTLGVDEGEPSPDVMVTIVARGVGPETVRLGPVDDLGPYLTEHQRLLGHFLTRPPVHPPPEELDPPPARGLGAHLALIESAIADAKALGDAARQGRRYRTPRDWGEQQGRLWEAAVRAQMDLAGQARDDANEAIGSLVNHMIQLSEDADWFGDPELRQAAIDESVRYIVFDSDVPSRPAQLAWQRSWARSQPLPPVSPPPEPGAIRELFASIEQDRSEWLSAWRHWVHERNR